jgi:hypothetical protein
MSDLFLQQMARARTHYESGIQYECTYCKRHFYKGSNVGAWECYQLVTSSEFGRQSSMILVRADHRLPGDPLYWSRSNNMKIATSILDNNPDLFNNLMEEAVIRRKTPISPMSIAGRAEPGIMIDNNISISRYDFRAADAFKRDNTLASTGYFADRVYDSVGDRDIQYVMRREIPYVIDSTETET